MTTATIDSQPPSPREVLSRARQVVVKLGSSLIAPPAGGATSLPGLCEDLAALSVAGAGVTLVSSGAVALGRATTGLAATGLATRQALSAIGQPALMALWAEAMAPLGLRPAQVLLTPDVTEDRTRYLNARAALRAIAATGCIAVVNENDAVATEELRAGDNDRLAARTAGLIGADTLVLLSDVDGLYSAAPGTPGAAHVPFLGAAELAGLDTTAMVSRSGVGTGGMGSKLRAAALASSWGVRVVIASGRHDRPLSALCSGEARGTVFAASAKPVPARRRWLSGRGNVKARLRIDEGAAAALRGGASLLAVGVTGCDGEFGAGDLIAATEGGVPVAFGLASCDRRALEGGESRTVIHRDDLVLERAS